MSFGELRLELRVLSDQVVALIEWAADQWKTTMKLERYHGQNASVAG